MGGSPKSEETDTLAVFHARDSQATEPDDPSAEKRRRLKIVQGVWKRMNKISSGDREFCIASIDRVAGECRRITNIFKTAAAIRAGSIYASKP
jgi:hypothetical protein